MSQFFDRESFTMLELLDDGMDLFPPGLLPHNEACEDESQSELAADPDQSNLQDYFTEGRQNQLVNLEEIHYREQEAHYRRTFMLHFSYAHGEYIREIIHSLTATELDMVLVHMYKLRERLYDFGGGRWARFSPDQLYRICCYNHISTVANDYRAIVNDPDHIFNVEMDRLARIDIEELFPQEPRLYLERLYNQDQPLNTKMSEFIDSQDVAMSMSPALPEEENFGEVSVDEGMVHFHVPTFSDSEDEESEDECELFPLNPKANAFLPRYDPTVPMTDIYPILQSWPAAERADLLRLKGYPEHLCRFADDSSKGRVRQLQTIQNRRADSAWTREKESKGHSARPVFTVFKKGRGNTGADWRLPVRFAHAAPKPNSETYTPDRFQRWVHGEVWKRRAELYKKTDFFSGNFPCQTLYFGCATTKTGLKSLLLAARVFVDDHFRPKQERFYHSLSEWFQLETPKRTIYFRGVPFTSAVEWATKVLPEMSKDMPWYNLGLDYLKAEEASTFDLALWQSNVDNRYRVGETGRHAPPRPNKSNKLRLQGGAMSVEVSHKLPAQLPPVRAQFDGLSDIQHTMNFTVNGKESNLSDAVKAAVMMEGLPWIEGYARTSVQIASFFTSVYYAPNFQAALAAVVQFVAGNEYLYTWSKSMLAKMTGAHVHLQGAMSEVWEKLRDEIAKPLWETLVTCVVVPVVQTTIGAFSGMLLPALLDVIHTTVGAMRFLVAREFASSVIDGVKAVIERIQKCWTEKSLQPIWGPKWSPTAWISETEAMVTHYITMTSLGDPRANDELERLRKQALIPGHWTTPVCVSDFVEFAEDHYRQGERIMEQFKDDSQVYVDLRQARSRFRPFIDTVALTKLTTTERREPLGIYLYGGAGVGKTMLAKSIFNAIAAKNGYDPTAVHQWVKDVNFHDGMNHTIWGVQLDDVDQGVAPPAAGQPTHIEDVISLINSKPLLVEQSAVELKGRIKANPLLVIQTSNYFDSKVTTRSAYPAAWWRRWHFHVTVEPKPAFTVGKGVLDKAKAFESDTHDMFVFKVRRFDESKVDPANQNAVCLTDAVEMSFPDFMVLCQLDYKSHLLRQSALLEQKVADGPICQMCGLPVSRRCGHDKIKLQGQTCKIVNDSIKAVSLAFKQDLYAKFTAFRLRMKLGVKLLANPGQSCAIVLNEIKARMSDEVKEVIKSLFTGAASLAVTAAIGFCIYRYLGPPDPKSFEDSDDEDNIKLQGREGNATEGLVPFGWLRANQTYKPGLPPAVIYPPFTKDDIMRELQAAHVVVVGRTVMHGFIVGHNLLLVPTHVAELGETLVVRTAIRDVEIQRTIMNSRVLATNEEIMLVRSGGLFGGPNLLSKFWLNQDSSMHQFDEVEIWSDQLVHKPAKNIVQTYEDTDGILATDASTQDGDCGMLYLCRFGKNWFISAMHYAVKSEACRGSNPLITMAALVTRREIEKLTAQLGTVAAPVVRYQGLLTKAERLQFTHYPAKSEVWAACSLHGAKIFPLGEIHPPIAGMSMKTKIRPSLFAEEARVWEEEWCGKSPYWNLPNFRGKMVEDKWVSPYTNMFATQNLKEPKNAYLWLALMDYLQGMDELDTSGYRELSEEEVLTGVQGSTIHAVNVHTSVGPPFNQSKQQFIALNRGDSHMDPVIWEQVDALEKILEEKAIPAAVSLCTLKDEPVKPDKMPRVFNNLPFACNFVAKKRLSPIKSFMRANVAHFESCVGINMTSLEVNPVVNALKVMNPALDKIQAGDVRALDKSWSGEMFDFVALVFYAVAWVLALNAYAVYLQILGFKYTTYVIKGDAFGIFNNPSGNDVTVELNGGFMSLGDRYVYFRLKYPDGLPDDIVAIVTEYMENFFVAPIPKRQPFLDYQMRNVLRHYGDDNVKASLDGVHPRYEEIWRDELGLEMTDERKEGSIKERPIAETSFLKRTFHWDEELKSYIPRLSKKSLARTLMWKKESILSDRDHACVALTVVSKELVYHGRDDYDRFMTWASMIAEKYGLAANPNLVLQPYDFWRDVLKTGAFQTWHNGDPFPRLHVTSGTFSYQGKMSSVSIAKAGTDPAHSNEQTNTTTMLVTPVTTVDSDSTMVQNYVNTNPAFFQKMPQNELSDYLLRPTEIATWTISEADLPGTLLNIDPWVLFLANTAIASKIANFSYIKAALEVYFVVALPGTCYGSYVLSALPNGGTDTADDPEEVAVPLYYENIMQVDNYVRIDCSSAENGVLQLPWLFPKDYAALPNGPVNSWKVYLSCLGPVQTGIPGGVTTGNIKVFARLMEGYEIVVPRLQGKRAGHLTPNHTMAHFAPETHKAVTQAAAPPAASSSEGGSHPKASAVAGKVAEIADKLSGVPLIGPYAETAAKAAHMGQKALSFFGFTRSSEEPTTVQVSHRSVSNVAHFEGPDASNGASLAFLNEISIDPTMAGGSSEDCLANAAMFQRWTIVKQFTWTPSAGSGDVLDSLYVSPSYCRSDSRIMAMTTAGYVGLPFAYWRGDMEYLVILPVSKLHRGSLQVAWIPEASVISGGITNRTFNYIFDVTAGGDKAFRVGYARELPYLENRPITSDIAIVPQGATNGQLVFRVVNPLKSQNADGAVTCTILARAGVNMDFAVPRNAVPYYYAGDGTHDPGIYSFPLANSFQLQGGAIGDEDAHETEMHDLVPSSGTYPGEQLLFGESFASARSLMQKPSRLYQIANADRYSLGQFGPLPMGGSSLNIQNYWTWFGWLRPLVVGIACSERYKLFTSGGVFAGVEPHVKVGVMADDGEISNPGTLAPMTYTGLTCGAEVQVPYYGSLKYRLARNANLNTNRENTIWNIGAQPLVIYHAAGPDIRVTGFRQVPHVYVTDSLDYASLTQWFITDP